LLSALSHPRCGAAATQANVTILTRHCRQSITRRV
jgi:hypothetical protein